MNKNSKALFDLHLRDEILLENQKKLFLKNMFYSLNFWQFVIRCRPLTCLHIFLVFDVYLLSLWRITSLCNHYVYTWNDVFWRWKWHDYYLYVSLYECFYACQIIIHGHDENYIALTKQPELPPDKCMFRGKHNTIEILWFVPLNI